MTERRTSEGGKLKIIVVGTFDDNGMPVGWCFGGMLPADYNGPAIWINPPDDPPEDIRIGGYTLDELRAIAELEDIQLPFYPPQV